MGHERKSSSLVGYQKSTGKVFSQRQPAGMGLSRIMHLDTAFVVHMPQSTQEEQASHCPVLRHSSAGKASNPQLAWAESPTILTEAAHQLGQSRATLAGARPRQISSLCAPTRTPSCNATVWSVGARAVSTATRCFGVWKAAPASDPR